MTLRQQLKERAEADLDKMVEEVHSAACQYKTVGGDLLLKLALDGQTSTIRTKAIRQLIDHAEGELLEQYTRQLELP